MSVLQHFLLVVAGFGAGLVGYVAGLASIVSYPALLAVGLGPIAANSARALVEVRPRQWRLGAVCALGGLTGGLILLRSPAGSFEAVVLHHVVLASLALLLQPRIRSVTGGKVMPALFTAGLGVVAL